MACTPSTGGFRDAREISPQIWAWRKDFVPSPWSTCVEDLGLFVRRTFGYGSGPAAMTTSSSDTPVNAFSVDVEDWYQVADFDAGGALRDLGSLRVTCSPEHR